MKLLKLLPITIFLFGCSSLQTVDNSISSVERLKGRAIQMDTQIRGIEGIVNSKISRIKSL